MLVQYVTTQMYTDGKYFLSDTADLFGFDSVVDAVNNISIQNSKIILDSSDINDLYDDMKGSLGRTNKNPFVIYTNDKRFISICKSLNANSILTYNKDFSTSYLCYNGINPSTDGAILARKNQWFINPLIKNMAVEIFL